MCWSLAKEFKDLEETWPRIQAVNSSNKTGSSTKQTNKSPHWNDVIIYRPLSVMGLLTSLSLWARLPTEDSSLRPTAPEGYEASPAERRHSYKRHIGPQGQKPRAHFLDWVYEAESEQEAGQCLMLSKLVLNGIVITISEATSPKLPQTVSPTEDKMFKYQSL